MLHVDVNTTSPQAMEETSWSERSIKKLILDLRQAQNWWLPATVLATRDDIAENLNDDMQVQCLPVSKSSSPKWTYRTVPKVTKFRNFGRIPTWSRRPQKMTYHLCAEDITKNCIVPSLPDEEKDDLLTRGVLPPESSARDKTPSQKSTLTGTGT